MNLEVDDGPFAQYFSVLGFDTAEQRYVWLVTSILCDQRLARVPYQAADVPDDEDCGGTLSFIPGTRR
jgi:hypothetical protein